MKHKIKASNKKIAEISLERVNNIIDRLIKPNYPEVEIHTKQASTSSIYIYLVYGKSKSAIGISDHPTKCLLHSYSCQGSKNGAFKESNVVGIIVRGIKRLKLKETYNLLDMLGKGE